MTLQNKQIVGIDDTASIRTFLKVILEDEGAIFHEAATGGDGIALCKEVSPDVVVLDLGLPDIDGLDVLPQIKTLSIGKPPIVIILSVRQNKATIAEAKAKGADGYLTKPFIVEDLLDVLEQKLS